MTKSIMQPKMMNIPFNILVHAEKRKFECCEMEINYIIHTWIVFQLF